MWAPHHCSHKVDSTGALGLKNALILVNPFALRRSAAFLLRHKVCFDVPFDLGIRKELRKQFQCKFRGHFHIFFIPDILQLCALNVWQFFPKCRILFPLRVVPRAS
ncbi:hypothetical protein B0H14DRAFT_3432481 [Mycena olivaceomarginata]|nr:hypothetical protein B0H14DRAFT_3432481 [Mycena olivaceomarginata]